MSTLPQSPRLLELPYSWAGREGTTRIEIWENDDPARYGCVEFARGFPCCRATLEPPATGYADMLGWVQMLDATYISSGFISDGFEPLGRLSHPFGFFGISPTLFDAPHTDDEDADFLAHTFLCGLGGELLEFRREARAVLGFSWGFAKRGSQFTFFGPDPLPPEGWERHRGYLIETFPDWTFPAGFHQHPLGP